MATFSVAKDTMFYTYNGIQDVPVRFSEITEGDPVGLTFADVEGETVLEKVTRRAAQ